MSNAVERDRELLVTARLNDQRGGFEAGVPCPFCREHYRPHPGFADHRDRCPSNPINRPHIRGTANAPGASVAPPGGDSRP